MSKPLVSIITPSLNRADFIELNIKSVMNQSYKNFEHIIVDGGSTDGTIEILKKYENKYNLKWISEPDKGMYDAINKGIKMAKGDIIAYLNTDDLYFPWTLEVISDNFEKVSADIIFGDCLIVQGNLFRVFLQPSKFSYKRLACYYGLSLPQPSTFFRKHIFEKVGYFDINYKLFGDIEFFVRSGYKGLNFHKVREILSIVVFHDRNLHKNKKFGNTEKDRIRKIYCNNTVNNIILRNLPLKYIDQFTRRFELLKFILNKNDWVYFKKFTEDILWLKFLFYEMLPERYKFALKDNYIVSEKLLNLMKKGVL